MNYTPRKRTDFIAVHSSATRADSLVDESHIRGWHKARGWQDIGYNIVILRSGVVQIGRPIDYQGAHVTGFNSMAVGVCLVGGLGDDGKPQDNFTEAQKKALITTLRFLRLYAPGAKIQGHRDFPGTATDCPSFDVRAFLSKHAADLL